MDAPSNPQTPPSPLARGFRSLLECRLGGLAVFGALVLAVSFLLRALLCFKCAHYLRGSWSAVAAAFGVGLFYDLVTLFYVTALPALVLLLLPDRLFRWRVTRWVFVGIFGVLVFLLLFDAASEWIFWDEFDSRFNFIAVDYLVYPTEVIHNILESYAFWPIVGTLAVAAAGITAGAYRFLRPTLQTGSKFRRRLAPAAFFILPALAAAWPVTSEFTNISANRYVNELAKNGLYSFGEAFFQPVLDFQAFYVTRPQADVLTHLRKNLKTPGVAFLAPADPGDITRRVESLRPPLASPPNVVLVLVESLSAEFLAYAGGEGLTPNLDALAEKSLLLANAYATGTRTVRGMEAVLLSLPPTPGQSVVKRLHQPPLFSLSRVLVDRGYDATFLYGGNGFFDNMNAFMKAHGCRIVDRHDFSRKETTFSNAWGLCDMDVFRRALKEADASAKKGKPFFQFILTTSNHRPFTFPDTPGITQKKGERGPAVQYTDWAIGQFIRKVSEAPHKAWADNTIFVIVADHCHNCRGKSQVPVDRFHIPILFYSPNAALVAPGRFEGLCSQIDLAPTLLGLMRVSYVSRFFGADVLSAPPARALMGTDQTLGLFKDDILTIIRPVKRLTAFRVNPDDTQDILVPRDDLALETLSWFQSAAALIEAGALSPRDTRIAPVSTFSGVARRGASSRP